jgi:hypothetical protein
MNTNSLPTLFSRYWLPLILIAIVLTRLPFLWTGYGADADAWFVANSASEFWHTGNYTESRLPGYPLHEIISAPFVALGGAPVSNLATLAATLIAVLVWNGIVRRVGQHQKFLVLAFAFAPVVWQNSAVTLDYMWSLLFILISLHATLNQWLLVAGVGLGIAAGFRPSNFILIVPLVCLMHLQKQESKQIVKFTFVALMTMICAFIPLMMKYGLSGWLMATQQEMRDVHPQTAMRFISFFYRTLYFIGPLAAMTAWYTLWKNRTALVDAIRSSDPLVVVSMAGIITFLCLFLWLPLERAYLLPAFPFFLLLVDKYSSSQAFILFTVLLVLSGLVNFDVIKADDRRSFGVNVHWGMVVEEFQNREDMLRARKEIASLSFPDRAVIMTSSGPAFWFENELLESASDNRLQSVLFYTKDHFRLVQQKGNPNTLFVAYLTRGEVDAVRNAGYQVLCLENAKKYVEPVVGYTMEEMNISVHETSFHHQL